jgi:ubiquitin fusion degradation protein 1
MFAFGAMPGGTFEAHYRAMPMAFIDKKNAEYGDKVMLPPSALDRLGEAGGRGTKFWVSLSCMR